MPNAILCDGQICPHRQCGGQNQTPIVIGMVSNQVYTAWSEKYGFGLSAINLLEFFNEKLLGVRHFEKSVVNLFGPLEKYGFHGVSFFAQ